MNPGPGYARDLGYSPVPGPAGRFLCLADSGAIDKQRQHVGAFENNLPQDPRQIKGIWWAHPGPSTPGDRPKLWFVLKVLARLWQKRYVVKLHHVKLHVGVHRSWG